MPRAALGLILGGGVGGFVFAIIFFPASALLSSTSIDWTHVALYPFLAVFAGNFTALLGVVLACTFGLTYALIQHVLRLGVLFDVVVAALFAWWLATAYGRKVGSPIVIYDNNFWIGFGAFFIAGCAAAFVYRMVTEQSIALTLRTPGKNNGIKAV